MHRSSVGKVPPCQLCILIDSAVVAHGPRSHYTTYTTELMKEGVLTPLFYSPTFYEIIQPCLGPGIFGHTFWGITKTVPANKKTFSLHILKQGTVEGLVLKLMDKE